MVWLRCLRLLMLITSGALVLTVPGSHGQDQPNAKPASGTKEISFKDQVVPLFKTYCLRCHGGEKPKADLALSKYFDDPAPLKHREVWDRVFQHVQNRAMPPEGARKPTQAEIDTITGWINAEFAKADCLKQKDPGRVTLRRLNRAEYNNTIRDLVGVKFKPADDFPLDDVGYGFDNIGDVLAMPPILFEKYLNAAEKVVDAAWKDAEVKRRLLATGDRRKDLERFARRAYRRPPAEAEINRLLSIVEKAERGGESAERGMQIALQAVLVSPHFLFKVELDPQPNKLEGMHAVSEFELATRLAYFLWSSMPDDELFDLAREGQLRRGDILDKQIRRMLKDAKAIALVDNFAGQWLQTRSVQSAMPDAKTYPAFDEELRAAMLKETELFFMAVMQEDRSVLDFLDADFTFVNERLARHYGMAGVKGPDFRRVSLKGTPRGGILTHASILTVTSNPTRTSPVKRGKYILENILGTPPPPPPPEVPELEEKMGEEAKGSLRERMEQHRANPMCASCHQRMDPLGFAFENFDGIGGWRQNDGKFKIDPAGALPDGRAFRGAPELRTILKSKDDLFRRCLTEKLLTYALGRGMEHYDRCVVDDIAKNVGAAGNRFATLVCEIVKSEPFQMRRGAPGKK